MPVKPSRRRARKSQDAILTGIYTPSGRSVSLTVPGIPPTVNHYKRTNHGRYFVTDKGVRFKGDIAILAAGRSLCAGMSESELRHLRYELEACVHLGYKQRGDGDNFWKCIADGLVKAGVIHSDAAVSDWIMRVRRDRDNPRTEITARIIFPKQDKYVPFQEQNEVR